MLEKKKREALVALMTEPNQKTAAEKVGITPRQMRNYLQDKEFIREYTRASHKLIDDATKLSHKCLGVALSTLLEVAQDTEEAGSVRVSASKALVDASLRLTEFSEILTVLDDSDVL